MAQPKRRSKVAPVARIAGRRGRPSADRVQAIDAAILSAAFEQFLDLGFDGASMDAIAVRAPVSKSTLYARYESKEALFRAVMDEEQERLSRRAGADDHLIPDMIEPRLRHHAHRLIEVFSWPEFEALNRLKDSAIRIAPELGHAWDKIATGQYLKLLADSIAEAADSGDIARKDCEFLSSLFLHAIAGWYRQEAVERQASAAEIAAFVDGVVDVILLAIRARAS